MEGVYEVLDELRVKGMCLGIISNAGDEGNVQRLIDNAQLRPYFRPIYISAALGIRKPNPKLFEMVLETWDLPADQVVMVGDNLGADILGAQNVGVHQIWLTTQADTPSNREHASVIVPEATAESITEVPALLLQLANTSPGD
jgi:putative hydrolase of the HAD superfamily